MRVMPQTSVTRVVQEIEISVASAHQILTADISLFLYKIQVHQAVFQVAVGKRLNFVMEFGAYLDAHPSLLPLICFSDEAHFWLEGYVNKRNCRIWASSNPDVFLTQNLHPKKITVWVVLSTQGLIGLIFVEKNVDGPVYWNILKKRPSKGDWSWPQYSLDLSPLDSFFWDYVNDRCYTNRLTTISALRKNINDIFGSLREDLGIFLLVTWYFWRHLERVLEREGGHIENVISMGCW